MAENWNIKKKKGGEAATDVQECSQHLSASAQELL
jgi:hypothetical protein